MKVHLALGSSWGTDEEHSLSEELAEVIDAAFEANGWGNFDGGDTGCGVRTLYIYNIPPARWDEAMAFVAGELERRQLRGRAVIEQVRIDWDAAGPMSEPEI